MFGTGVKWGQNRVLLKQAFLSENNFYGFDFKDTWEMTKQGPKLCRQVEDDTLEFFLCHRRNNKEKSNTGKRKAGDNRQTKYRNKSEKRNDAKK